MVIVIVAVVIAVVVVMIVAMVALIVPMIAVIIPMLVTMLFTIMGNIGMGVPVMPDEVHRLAAGVVLAAMTPPIALVTGAHMQIDRRRQFGAANPDAHDGRAIDKARRRCIADIHAAVKSGVAQTDGGGHLGECCAADCQGCNADGKK